MGCDGGTIPRRDELVKTKKKPEQKDKASELSFRWQHCAITQQPLQTPIVACEMGRLYSKESVIESLLDNKSQEGSVSLSDVAPHIKTLRDIKELALTDNPDWIELTRGEAGNYYIDNQKAKWICPVSGIEMNGRFRFCYLWTCGCVFSEKALKEMMKLKEEGNECPKCNKTFAILDIINLNAVEDRDISTLVEKMELRRILAKEAKDKKKAAKKRPAATATVTSEGSSSNGNGEGKELALALTTSTSGTSASRKSEKGKGEPEASSSSSKRPKIVPTPRAAAGSAASAAAIKAGAGTSNYNVAKDPRASEVYKSLFTTHASEANQERAHWVTYNPFYN